MTFLILACTFNYCASGWCWVHCIAILLLTHVILHYTSECVDSKAVLVHNVKAYGGTGGVAPYLLKLDIILDSLTYHCFMATKGARCTHWIENCFGTHNQSGFWRKKKSLALSKIRTPHCPVHCLVTILTTLTQTYWVRFSVLFNNNTHSQRLYFKFYFKDNSCF